MDVFGAMFAYFFPSLNTHATDIASHILLDSVCGGRFCTFSNSPPDTDYTRPSRQCISFFPRQPVRKGGCSDIRCVSGLRSLSFDRKVYQTLTDSQVPATIFLSGKWIRTHTKETEELAANPLIELGNHSYSHHHMASMSPDSILSEIQKVQTTLFKVYQKSAKVFRAPYGELSGELVQTVRSMGLTAVQFDLASGDPDTSISKERLVRYVVRSARNGSIIVMHINGRGRHTAEALPEIIRGLHKRGFRLVTIAELMRNSTVAVKKQ